MLLFRQWKLRNSILILNYFGPTNWSLFETLNYEYDKYLDYLDHFGKLISSTLLPIEFLISLKSVYFFCPQKNICMHLGKNISFSLGIKKSSSYTVCRFLSYSFPLVTCRMRSVHWSHSLTEHFHLTIQIDNVQLDHFQCTTTYQTNKQEVSLAKLIKIIREVFTLSINDWLIDWLMASTMCGYSFTVYKIMVKQTLSVVTFHSKMEPGTIPILKLCSCTICFGPYIELIVNAFTSSTWFRSCNEIKYWRQLFNWDESRELHTIRQLIAMLLVVSSSGIFKWTL